MRGGSRQSTNSPSATWTRPAANACPNPMSYATVYTRNQATRAMIPGTSRNQNQANGVTNTATRKVTSSARGSVFLGFPFDTAATDTITTSAWINHDDIFSASQVMAGR